MAADKMNIGLGLEERTIRLNRAFPSLVATKGQVGEVLRKYGYNRKVARTETPDADTVGHKNARIRVVK
jgi:hypothetical protein